MQKKRVRLLCNREALLEKLTQFWEESINDRRSRKTVVNNADWSGTTYVVLKENQGVFSVFTQAITRKI